MVSLKKVLAAAMQHEEVALRLKEALSAPIAVDNEYDRAIAQFLGEHLDKYGELPQENDYKDWINHRVSEGRRAALRKALSRLLSTDVNRTPEHFAEIAMGVIQKTASENVASHIRGTPPDEITKEFLREMTEMVERLEPVTISDMADLRDVDEWVRAPERNQGMTTGIGKLDELIGGWQDGELIYVLADTGVGKSVSLVNHAHAAVLGGANVVHLTFEMSREKNAYRFARLVTETDRDKYRERVDRVREDVRAFWKWAPGDYRILERDAKSMTPEQLRDQVRLYQRYEGEIDLLILDYMELMAPSPEDAHLKPHEQLGRMAHKVRNVGREYEFPVLSPHQAVRPKSGQETHEELYLSKSSKSYDMIRAGDVVIGLVRSPKEQKHNQGHYTVLKVRDAPGLGAKIPLFVDLDIMTIAELDSPETREIMDRHGHDSQKGFVQAEEDEDEATGS